METSASYQVDIVAFLKRATSFATRNNYTLALWRMPLTNAFRLIIGFDEMSEGKVDVENAIPGFYFASFENTELTQSRFLKADILYRISTDGFTPLLSNEAFEEHLNNEQDDLSDFYFLDEQLHDTPKSDYENHVRAAIGLIEHTDLKKVVISKVRTRKKPLNIDLLERFITISDSYPNAFVSLVSSPKVGTWLGASPELLISIDKENQFKTVALAGTQALVDGQSLKHAVWTQKEIEEQALVSRYIIHCLKTIRLREFEDIGPKTIKAGNLLHLKTEFLVNINEVNFPNLGSVMLELLHPTSAVCGMPKEEALSFIRKHEKHNRSFYSGFLGPVNIENETHLFVNLRCVQLLKTMLVFYAGAGITEDSVPEKEWLETEQKCDILGRIFE